MALGTILTAILTPFSDDGRVDEDAFVALHQRVVELAVSERPEGTTVIAGTGSNDTQHAVHMTERATELGVDAVLSVTPYYNKPPRRGLVAHYREIAGATDK